MHVIITLAGHSRRFKAAGYELPKFLLEVDGRTVVEHVLEMFGEDDIFHFVLNHQQVKENPKLIEWLSEITPRCDITIIEPHDHGPVHSVLQVKSIDDDEPVLISYCDFTVTWNYRRFLREIQGYDSAMPAFRGFHPASFGNTYYAYLRVSDGMLLQELREKKSFTDRRHEEFASAGIYYFGSWKLFKSYAKKLQLIGFSGLNEGYVSLLSNLMIQDGLLIRVTEVDRFVCWGTPEDFEQYKFWSNYFRGKNVKKISKQTVGASSHKTINIIPMAGRGSRFKQANYKISKPLVSIGNQPMVERACNSFPFAEKWIFMALRDDLRKYPIESTIRRSISGEIVVIPVEGVTTGQAATCLLARSEFHDDDHLLIASCDYETVFDHDAWLHIVQDEDIDAVIWTCRLGACLTKSPEAFAYCVTDTTGKNVTKIIEKRTISDSPGMDPLVVGTFWFRRASDFVRSAQQAIERNIHVNGEHYIANSMNILLEEGKKIVIFEIVQWISFGDPFELDLYYYWNSYFYEKYSSKFLVE